MHTENAGFVREGRLFRVVSFAASQRLLLRSEPTAVDDTDTRATSGMWSSCCSTRPSGVWGGVRGAEGAP